MRDIELVQRARQGDREAFEVLVRRHSGKAYGVAMSMMHNPIDAQDVVQDAFFNAYRKLDTFRGEHNFSSWLCRIVHNGALMKMRTRRRRPEVPLEVQMPGETELITRPIAEPGPDSGELLLNQELGAAIDEAVDGLPEAYRTVFLLADVQHLTMREIAETLDISVPNAKTRLHRARTRLRQRLSHYLDADAAAPFRALAC
jgi:RNA polymerase sigma-70 factor (ECF subfamily)